VLGEGATFRLAIPGWVLSPTGASDHGSLQSDYLSGQRLRLDQALFTQVDHKNDNLLDYWPTDADQSSHAVLVVEDNADLRQYLVELLSGQWQVHQAADGVEALQMLHTEDIDVVLADIMMPNMDGLTLLKHVRDSIDTSHVPFLLLSARHDTETRLAGLTLAADDFLTKPFAPEELRLKLRNVVLARELLRSAILRSLNRETGSGNQSDEADEALSDTSGHLSPRDHQFLQRLDEWVDLHCYAPDWSVTTMAEQLAVNERTLQRKIRALTGLTPVQFVNERRLSQAKVELQDPARTIQEIAFDLGFGSQQSFSRAFKQAFACTPSQWREKKAHPQR